MFIDMHLAIQGEGPDMGFPTIMVRTTGCNLRCQFGETDFCDAWMSSWRPEKTRYDLKDLELLMDENPFIMDLILTGGEPTMHSGVMRDLLDLCDTRNVKVSIETNGTLQVDKNILDRFKRIIISPKMINSAPIPDTKTPYNTIVTTKQRDSHLEGIKELKIFEGLRDYDTRVFFKIVVQGNKDLDSVTEMINNHKINYNNIFLMPAGGSRDELIPKYAEVMEMCLANNFKFSPRIHIIGYDERRDV